MLANASKASAIVFCIILNYYGILFGAFKVGFSLGGNAFEGVFLTIEGKKKAPRSDWRFFGEGWIFESDLVVDVAGEYQRQIFRSVNCGHDSEHFEGCSHWKVAKSAFTSVGMVDKFVNH